MRYMRVPSTRVGHPGERRAVQPGHRDLAATGSMTTPREDQTATLLNNGQVLVSGGENASGTALASAELYNPATGQWSAAANGLAACGTATECRFGSTAALLATGNVLVTGGLAGTNSNPGTTNAAILYNPATNSWTATGSMTTAREGQTADLLASGQVLVAGGETFAKHAGTPLASAELYTP